MRASYTANYIKIYLWKAASLILNFFSMFIVIPYLSAEPVIYGIYTICISISIFLAYADFGFMVAGQKYAAEYFVRGELKEEIEVIGFTSFILLVFLLLFSIGFLFLSFHPVLLINNLTAGKQENIASSLLLILALFVPATFLPRLLQMIFGIRMEDYIVQRTNIIASLLKILSVLWFFRGEEYDIVGYFLFMQIVNLLFPLLTLFIARRRYNYDFKVLLKSIHFNKDVFAKTKSLAFMSLYSTFTYILFYEFDPAVIGRLLGAKQVAIFAIGLTIMSYFRGIMGILFSPFSVRFNHFIGNNDEDGLKSFFSTVTILMAPIIIIPVITVCLMARPLILSWVGPMYSESITTAQFLILCSLFAFISVPTSLLLMAQERIRVMYFVNTLIPLVYWIGIVLSYSTVGLNAFAFFKLLVFSISSMAYVFILKQYLDLSINQLIQQYIRPLLLPLIFLFVTAFFITDYLPIEKSKMNLLVVSLASGLMIILSFLLVYFSSSYYKSQSLKIFSLFKKIKLPIPVIT